MKNWSNHYDADYFRWQSSVGEFGGWANVSKFVDYVKQSSNVLDFGCGGGYLLKNLRCRSRMGVEINPDAARVAGENGIQVFPNVAAVPENSVDVIISNHALEHVANPFDVALQLYAKLKPGGTIVFVVPCETIRTRYSPRDRHFHLYTWSPSCLGNLFTAAGFEVTESLPYVHKWPPYYRTIAGIVGRRIFDMICRVYARLERSTFQVRIVANKPREESA